MRSETEFLREFKRLFEGGMRQGTLATPAWRCSSFSEALNSHMPLVKSGRFNTVKSWIERGVYPTESFIGPILKIFVGDDQNPEWETLYSLWASDADPPPIHPMPRWPKQPGEGDGERLVKSQRSSMVLGDLLALAIHDPTQGTNTPEHFSLLVTLNAGAQSYVDAEAEADVDNIAWTVKLKQFWVRETFDRCQLAHNTTDDNPHGRRLGKGWRFARNDQAVLEGELAREPIGHLESTGQGFPMEIVLTATTDIHSLDAHPQPEPSDVSLKRMAFLKRLILRAATDEAEKTSDGSLFLGSASMIWRRDGAP